jgi:preprotein translocase subunit SecG
MYSVLITLSILLSVLLIIIVLLQSSKGGGLSGSIGGGAGNMGAMFGTRRTADFLSQATWWIGGGLLVLAIVINLGFLPGKSTSSERESIIQQLNEQQAVPSAPALPPATTTQSEGDQPPPQDGQ